MMISGTGGGNIMQQMLQDMRSRAFTGADADSSGGLSKDEFRKLGENGPPGMAGPAGSAATREARPEGGTETAKGSGVERLFTALDTDSDGSLTETELGALQPPSMEGGFGAGGLASLLGAQEQSQSGSSLAELFNQTESDTGSDTMTESESFDPVRILADLLGNYAKQALATGSANGAAISISA